MKESRRRDAGNRSSEKISRAARGAGAVLDHSLDYGNSGRALDRAGRSKDSTCCTPRPPEGAAQRRPVRASMNQRVQGSDPGLKDQFFIVSLHGEKRFVHVRNMYKNPFF